MDAELAATSAMLDMYPGHEALWLHRRMALRLRVECAQDDGDAIAACAANPYFEASKPHRGAEGFRSSTRRLP